MNACGARRPRLRVGIYPQSLRVEFCNYRTCIRYNLKHQKLTKLGANVNRSPNAACIPVFYALQRGRIGIVEILISLGKANLHAVDDYGHGLLTAAARSNNLDAVLYVLTTCPDLTEPAEAKSTPLHEAILNKNLKIFTALLASARCSPGTPCDKGKTPLQLACELGRLEFVRCLLDDDRLHAEFAEDHKDGAILHQTLLQKQYGLVALLLTHKKPCHPTSNFVVDACKQRQEALAWKAFDMISLSINTATDLRNCARNQSLHTLASMMTHKYDLD